MRNGQNKRMRGRNRGKSHNPLTRVYESNGPDVKIRGTANHVAEKYIQLARDAQASGDPVSAENYYQHAEHYFRLIAAAQEQFRQSQPFYQQQQQQQPQQQQSGGEQPRDDSFDDGDEDLQPQSPGEPHYVADQQQPYPPREPQPYQPRPHQQHQSQPHHQQHRPHYEQRSQQGGDVSDVGGLPSFITGGQGQPQPVQHGYGGQNGGGYDNQPDRFPLHRRRRRGHRGPRPDMHGGSPAIGGAEAPDDSGPGSTGE
jgi:hypothetical protein